MDTKVKSKAGRPPIDLKYDEAQAAYWNQREKFEEAGEGHQPTQDDFCAFLASMGKPISTTTLQKHIRAWRKEGLLWPPPLPETET
jgi:hypothetical protein